MQSFIAGDSIRLIAESEKDRQWLTTAIARESQGAPLQIVGAGNVDGVCQHLTIGPREAKNEP